MGTNGNKESITICLVNSREIFQLSGYDKAWYQIIRMVVG